MFSSIHSSNIQCFRLPCIRLYARHLTLYVLEAYILGDQRYPTFGCCQQKFNSGPLLMSLINTLFSSQLFHPLLTLFKLILNVWACTFLANHHCPRPFLEKTEARRFGADTGQLSTKSFLFSYRKCVFQVDLQSGVACEWIPANVMWAEVIHFASKPGS